MVAVPEVNSQEWSSLYEAARRFRDQASWNWVSDEQVFAVLDPTTHEPAYCCVLGMAGEVFGLVAYLGSRGLDQFQRMQSGALGPDDPRLLIEQDCLAVDFTDRDMLEKEDFRVIRQLGLRFRGRGAWPVFRNYRPNYAPWFLEEEQVRFLTVILEQSFLVCERLKENPDLLTPPRDDVYFLRRLEGKEWVDAWLEPEPYTPPVPPELHVDEIRLFRTREQARGRAAEWQLDLLVLPGMIMDRERPYFARLLVCVDSASGFVLAADTMDPWTYSETLLESVLAPMEAHSAMPERILVRDEALKSQLGAPLARIGIDVEVSPSLDSLEEAESSLLSAMSGGMPEDW